MPMKVHEKHLGKQVIYGIETGKTCEIIAERQLSDAVIRFKVNAEAAQEYFRLFANLAEYSRISLAGLLDYAHERRPAGLELARHIKAEFLKKSALIGSNDAP